MGEMMGNRAVKNQSGRGWRKPNLREGFSTSACAAAAAAAATRSLLTGGHPVDRIEIELPVGRRASFDMVRFDAASGAVTCGVVKDAGDDPDVTHGAEICATVQWQPEPGVTIVGGEGVGVVTRPGLAVEVGQAAINPGSRRLIAAAVLGESQGRLAGAGLKVTISVPAGAELAGKTMNPRLGIVGGISILGTTGIVKPYSRAAFRASIFLELRVAARTGLNQAILTTGRRSEQYALRWEPGTAELGCVQVGDHVGYALRQVRRLQFRRVIISGMIGKVSKLAQGRMDTHVSEGGVDLGFLAEIVHQMGGGVEWSDQVLGANTAHHVQLLLRRGGMTGLETELARRAAQNAYEYVGKALDVTVLLWDVGGDLLGSWQVRRDR